MTRTEDNAWYMLCGILIGLMVAFWFAFDIDFYRTVWAAMAVIVIVWAFVRRESNDKCRENQGNDGARNGKLD
jgi:membrane protein implicated in regulation of membrane protease activity